MSTRLEVRWLSDGLSYALTSEWVAFFLVLLNVATLAPAILLFYPLATRISKSSSELFLTFDSFAFAYNAYYEWSSIQPPRFLAVANDSGIETFLLLMT